MCLECKRQSMSARECQTHGCNKMLPHFEPGDHCEAHAPGIKTAHRKCSEPSCSNNIAAKIQGNLCRVCLARKGDGRKQIAKQPARARRPQRQLLPHGASSASPSYQQYPYPPYGYPPRQEIRNQPHQHIFQHQPYQPVFHGQPLEQTYQGQFSFQQPQSVVNRQVLQVPPQHLQYPGQQLMMSPHVLPQQPDSRFNYSSQLRQIDGHRSSFVTQRFHQEARPLPPDLPLPQYTSPPAKSLFTFDDTQHLNALPNATLSLSDISRSARRTRVMAMQRMLKSPCLGCLRSLGEEEASTHPQIYCVHLSSAERRTVLSDREQWKQMCASGQEAEDGEIDSDTDQKSEVHLLSRSKDRTCYTNEQSPTATIKWEKQAETPVSPLSTLIEVRQPTECQSTSVSTPAGFQELPQTQPSRAPEQTESFRQDGDFMGSTASALHDHLPLPAQKTMTTSNAVSDTTNPSGQAPSAREDSGAPVRDVPGTWAADSIRELLELKSAAEPGTPLEVAIALQQELRNCLLLDVTEGDPQDGEPSAIGLLRVLDQRIEALQARSSDG